MRISDLMQSKALQAFGVAEREDQKTCRSLTVSEVIPKLRAGMRPILDIIDEQAREAGLPSANPFADSDKAKAQTGSVIQALLRDEKLVRDNVSTSEGRDGNTLYCIPAEWTRFTGAISDRFPDEDVSEVAATEAFETRLENARGDRYRMMRLAQDLGANLDVSAEVVEEEV